MKRLLLPLFAVALVAACGNEEDSTATPPASTPPAAEAPAQTPVVPAPPAAPATEAPTTPATEAPAAEAPAAEAPAATTETGQTGSNVAMGEEVYKKTCFLCHGTGAGGAPMLTDKADWEKRLAQGMDTLYKHAIEGYTGEKGMMPPKGGNLSLSDEDVKASVDYMAAQVK